MNKNTTTRPTQSFWKKLGHGLVTGVRTMPLRASPSYSQAGAEFGYGVLWTVLFTFPRMVRYPHRKGSRAAALLQSTRAVVTCPFSIAPK